MHYCDKAHSVFYREIEKYPKYQKQVDKILEKGEGDIDATFLGFLGIYYALSKVIPKDRIIYDLGCAYCCQSWFFRNHKSYIAIDYLTDNAARFITPNSKHYKMTISKFLKKHEIQEPHFAICSYVPPWVSDNEKLTRDNFKHLFVYYPVGNCAPFLKKIAKKVKELEK